MRYAHRVITHQGWSRYHPLLRRCWMPTGKHSMLLLKAQYIGH